MKVQFFFKISLTLFRKSFSHDKDMVIFIGGSLFPLESNKREGSTDKEYTDGDGNGEQNMEFCKRHWYYWSRSLIRVVSTGKRKAKQSAHRAYCTE